MWNWQCFAGFVQTQYGEVGRQGGGVKGGGAVAPPPPLAAFVSLPGLMNVPCRGWPPRERANKEEVALAGAVHRLVQTPAAWLGSGCWGAEGSWRPR